MTAIDILKSMLDESRGKIVSAERRLADLDRSTVMCKKDIASHRKEARDIEKAIKKLGGVA